MPTRNLSKIFEPRSVVVIAHHLLENERGSNFENSVGRGRASSDWRTVLNNLRSGGFPGPIYHVDAMRGDADVEYKPSGRLVFPSVGDLPSVPDLAIIDTDAEEVSRMVRECGIHGILGLVILSTGFRELGTLKGRTLEESVRCEAASFPGTRIVGPNSMGVISPGARLNASHVDYGGSATMSLPRRGGVAFVSQSERMQSGRSCAAILDWADRERVGFSHFVSAGNMLDVNVADLIDFFASDRATQSLVLYVESITDAREFMSAARNFSREKPIIAFKAGRFALGPSVCAPSAVSSQLGSMVTTDLVYRAAFDRAGVVRVLEMEDMFDCAELLAKHRKPLSGPRLGIITNAAGPGVVAADSLLLRKGVLAQFEEGTVHGLSRVLPFNVLPRNPIDLLDVATPGMLASVLKTIISDGSVDAAIVIFAPQAGVCPTEAAKEVIDTAKQTQKPILATWMGGSKVEDGIKLLNNAGIPTYATPEHAVRAFMYLASYGRTREVLYETPRDVPVELSIDRDKINSKFECLKKHNQDDVLEERASKMLLSAYGIPTSTPIIARTVDDAVLHARKIGYPVAIKVYPQITHKTYVDGVSLDVTNDDDVTSTFRWVVQNARQRKPNADIIGVTVQRIISDPLGVQLLIGAKYDPVFGMVMIVGMGGVGAEVYNDLALELPPLNERLAQRMLESLRLWPLLNGYAGRPAVNIDALIEVLIRMSYLVSDLPGIRELDVNPLLVSQDEVIALDARIIIHSEPTDAVPRTPYPHLAIRPYPQDFVRPAVLKDGSPVLLRPIKPEDEPMWHEMLAGCSQETIMFRFFMLFKNTTHEMATRYCFIDYDREMAIVAEMRETCGTRRLIGVGRIVSNADHKDAEYAVVVQDGFQGKGLGSILTEYCIAICRKWGIETVIAETSPKNRRMLELFAHRGFQLTWMVEDDIVIAKKELV